MNLFDGPMGKVVAKQMLDALERNPKVQRDPFALKSVRTLRGIIPDTIKFQPLTYSAAVDALRGMNEATLISFETEDGEIHNVVVL
jgi:hypothetical protein